MLNLFQHHTCCVNNLQVKYLSCEMPKQIWYDRLSIDHFLFPY